jgi:hypothetical protein
MAPGLMHTSQTPYCCHVLLLPLHWRVYCHTCRYLSMGGQGCGLTSCPPSLWHMYPSSLYVPLSEYNAPMWVDGGPSQTSTWPVPDIQLRVALTSDPEQCCLHAQSNLAQQSAPVGISRAGFGRGVDVHARHTDVRSNHALPQESLQSLQRRELLRRQPNRRRDCRRAVLALTKLSPRIFQTSRVYSAVHWTRRLHEEFHELWRGVVCSRARPGV